MTKILVYRMARDTPDSESESSRSRSRSRGRYSRSRRSRTRRSRSRRSLSRRSRSTSRSRDRSRGRTGRRSRSASADSRVERSASRSLLEEDDIRGVPQLIKAQQDFLVDLIADHKQEVESKLKAKKRRFSSKPLEKQAEVNFEFQELVEKALLALKKGNKKRTKTTLKKLRDRLKEHQQDLVIADTSPNGWLAVARLRNRSELPDSLRKKLERVDKEIWRSRSYGGPQKKFARFQGQGGGGDVRTRRPQQKLSPEELLYNASRQIRAGTCSHCKKENHFYRECPDFWTKVQESRGKRVEGLQAAN